MDTEELNKYVFTTMVMKNAITARNKRVDAMVEQGEITTEQSKAIAPNFDDVREALSAMRHNRKAVFDTLAELLAAETAGNTNQTG